MSKLIGIAGKAGAGKDTVAGQLAVEYGFLCTSFATPLKAAASALFGLPLDFFVDRDKKDARLLSWDRSPRQLMCALADKVKAGFGEDVFVKAWMAQVTPVLDLGCNVLVSDVRFKHEVEAVKLLGGTIIYIDRDVPETSVGSHCSEQFVPAWANTLILNHGDLVDLRNSVRATISQLK